MTNVLVVIFAGLLLCCIVGHGSGSSVCRDTRRECRLWAHQDQCTRNVFFMESNCCHACSEACRDIRRDCSAAAKRGRCNDISVLTKCKKTCGMCCSNYNKKCDVWAQKNQCAANPRFMGQHCLKSCKACSSPCRPCTNAQYSAHWKIEGFRIRAEVGVFYRWPTLTLALRQDFKKLKAVVPAPAVKLLQRFSGLYISKLKLCSTYPKCSMPAVADAYHVSKTWLRRNHGAPEKAGFVDMMNPGEYLIRRSFVEKYNLLHEFFHAWYDIRRRAALAGDAVSAKMARVVKAAWQSARASGIYRSVPYAGGGRRPGYAIESEWEYMGELSEAFFARGSDRNDYYPYNRQELRKFDPKGFAAINYIWSPPYPTRVAPAGTAA